MKNILIAATITLALFVLLTVTVHASTNLLTEQTLRISVIRKTLPAIPADWHFIVVSDDDWRHIIDKNGLNHGSPQSAVSNLKNHITFVRAAYAMQAPDWELRKTIAHEMGHYLCGCTDENKANFFQDQIQAILSAPVTQ